MGSSSGARVVRGGEIVLQREDLAGLMRAVLEKGKAFRFEVRGASMRPVIRDGDVVTVSPLAGLQVTPEVPERFQFDLGASYRWMWNNLDMRLSLNIYNVFDDTYDVNITTLDTRNPITGAEVTKRTEKYYTPTTFRVGLAVSF